MNASVLAAAGHDGCAGSADEKEEEPEEGQGARCRPAVSESFHQHEIPGRRHDHR